MSVARLGYDQAGDSFLYPRLRPLTRRPVVRTGVVSGEAPKSPNFAADHHRAKLPLFRHASSCPLFDRLTINRLGTEWARIDEGVYDACRDLRDYRPPRW